MIYTTYDSLNIKLSTKSFLSTKTLLNNLYITNQTAKTAKNDIGIENFISNPEEFSKNFAVMFAECGKDGETIVAPDDSSFLSLKYARNYILSNSSFKKEVEKMLGSLELTTNFLADVIHINTLLMDSDTLQYMGKNIKHLFQNFRAAMHIGSDFYFDADTNISIDNFFNTIKLKRVHFGREFMPSGYDILKYSPETAFKMAGSILLDAFDNGIDFLISNDMRAFYMFDKCRKKVEKAVGRAIPIYILTMAQVALMAIGITDKKMLGFDSHNVKPTILG